ncbi:phosphatidylinositol N-acetylglucosaminyltransferase subunit P isoform X2 [Selaginella moellendorffii]|uniref:phosphatidylinositol N-acetylglucosaminyltransferase subunit P isoform X2 n=1 Tax=Selaginella moellendorffii TaxID=88036 RepID=UPI000D1C67C2|nr:phosphatidylinositol N-acetylglucosaminyltransferase subunit P isoform X2 [Selaginella moellendorffii]|eukprot:XP_024520437.1 phosphatidylinositol N-acetylglucosaminyltransferase subunit P isoform X2 [Selaginella moellendorffii]
MDHEKRKCQGTQRFMQFVGAISNIVAFGVCVIWACLPEPWLHYLGITSYPDKLFMLAIPFVLLIYASLNHLATPPASSLNTLFVTVAGGQAIQPIGDLPFVQVNRAMFVKPLG